MDQQHAMFSVRQQAPYPHGTCVNQAGYLDGLYPLRIRNPHARTRRHGGVFVGGVAEKVGRDKYVDLLLVAQAGGRLLVVAKDLVEAVGRKIGGPEAEAEGGGLRVLGTLTGAELAGTR